jgi:uncharacterized repeat protein (TIGR01451 family)
VQIGDLISFRGEILTNNQDCTPLDNTLEQTYLVYGAIDPNDILVSPKGYGEEGYILPNQALTYTIRFENFGNFPAQKVTITDDLPNELDINTLKMISSSHENVKTEIEGRTIKFVWEDMFLPPSEENATDSQGYVSFLVSPMAGIDPETKIINNASIQFDTYLPITTNSVLNTIQSKEEEINLVEVKTYPNPVNDVVYISLTHKMGDEFTNKLITKAEIVSMQGITVLTKEFDNQEEIRIDLPIDLRGIYLIKITDSEDKNYIKKIIIKDRF